MQNTWMVFQDEQNGDKSSSHSALSSFLISEEEEEDRTERDEDALRMLEEPDTMSDRRGERKPLFPLEDAALTALCFSEKKVITSAGPGKE